MDRILAEPRTRRLVLRLGASLAACLAALPLAGCGGSPSLSKGDANQVKADRADLRQAIMTTQTLVTSPGEARRLVGSVTRTLAVYGALKTAVSGPGAPSQFQSDFSKGLAKGAVQSIANDVPSLVVGGATSPVGVSEVAVRGFVANAVDHPEAALHAPAADAVNGLLRVLERKSPDTKVPGLPGQTASSVLREASLGAGPYWPDLATRLEKALLAPGGHVESEAAGSYVDQGDRICKAATVEIRAVSPNDRNQFPKVARIRADARAKLARLHPPKARIDAFLHFLLSFDRGQLILERAAAAVAAGDVAAARRLGHQLDAHTPEENRLATAAGLSECAK